MRPIAAFASAAIVVMLRLGVALANPSAVETRSTSDVCEDEKLKLSQLRRQHDGHHPAVVLAGARVEAACQPAPTADCSLARADLAEFRSRYKANHPSVVERRTRADVICTPAPSKQCARARADLAVARGNHLDRHPIVVEAQKAVARSCPTDTPPAPAAKTAAK